jgi:EPS-associated MarR family transcriptional regulator
MSHDITDEIRYRLLHYLQDHPEATQRELARHLEISIGKVNYCLRALIEKGWLKMRNFRNANNKLAYAYHLTPKGLEEKLNVTYAFLRRKMAEYDAVQAEIERLSREVAEFGDNADSTTNV